MGVSLDSLVQLFYGGFVVAQGVVESGVLHQRLIVFVGHRDADGRQKTVFSGERQRDMYYLSILDMKKSIE